MPKVFLTREMRLREELAVWICGQMKVNRLTQLNVARELGITQQGLCKKIKRRTFSYDDMLFFFAKFQPDKETVMRLTGADEWTRE
jgi:predicted XRE-type DNA-binding protein